MERRVLDLQALPKEVASLLEGLLPEQLDVVTTLDRPVFVAAGAGSGKTFTLTRRIVWALCPGSGEGGAPYLDSLDQALVITFTEKAAGEIKERVRGALRAAGLAEQALKVDGAWVSTIHHMCARILRTNALDLGIDPGFVMVGEQEAGVLRAQATERALAELAGDPGVDALFAEYTTGGGQRDRAGVLALVGQLRNKAASATLGFDSLEFAGGGTDVYGEVAAALRAYEALCAQGNKDPEELAACEAARDTLAAFVELPPSARTAQAAVEMLEGAKVPNGNKWRAAAVKEFCREAKACHSRALAEARLACAEGLADPLMRLARRIDDLYAEAKRARRALDNDDLLLMVARAFRDHPRIAAHYADKFRLVMVDEFQDTNGQQVDMVEGLSGEGACHLTTVGDAQQAIYGFRGADVGVFEERRREVGDEGLVLLDRNFRSDDAVLRFVARTCGDTGIVPAFMDLRAARRPTDAFDEGRHPRVCVELTRAHRAGRSVVKSGLRRPVAAAQLADRLARIREAGVEPRRMAVLLRGLRGVETYIDALRERGIESVVVGGSTFAEAPEVRCVQALLRCLANPADTKSGLFPVLSSGMFALDADDLLVLATKPQETVDAPAKRRIYPGVRPDSPLFAGVAQSERLARAREVLARAWGRVGRLPVADVCLMAIRESGWLERLEARGVEGRSVAANVLAAVRHVRELTEDAGFDAMRAADEFGRWLDAAKAGPASLSGEGLDAVSIMTAHASKGLEFDVVAVAGCCGSERAHTAPKLLSRRAGDRVLLSLAPREWECPDLGEDAPAGPEDCSGAVEWRCLLESEQAEAEEREEGRLLYVALTRARECVVLCLSGMEGKDGALKPAMTQAVAEGLFADRPLPGEGAFDYGGAAPGLVRCVDLSPCEGGAMLDAAGTLPTLPDGFLPLVPTDDAADGAGAPALGGYGSAASEGASGSESATGSIAWGGSGGSGAPGPDGSGGADASGAAAPDATSSGTPAPFDIYDIDASTHAELGSWRPREGVFSYSSAHRALAEGAVPGACGAGDLLDLPACAWGSCGDDAFWPDLATAGEDDAPSRGASVPTRPARLSEDGGAEDASEAQDVDRATSLGSAFHELARYMVETGAFPDEGRIAVAAASWGVGKRDRRRLDEALARWRDSDVRAEALGHALVRAEVPFFVPAGSPLGDHLEGAIDLLAVDAIPAFAGGGGAKPAALLVDYKTGDRGLDAKRVLAAHEMQTRFYAGVLQGQGYGEVTCAFVCVERDDGHGQPVVARYRFDA